MYPIFCAGFWRRVAEVTDVSQELHEVLKNLYTCNVLLNCVLESLKISDLALQGSHVILWDDSLDRGETADAKANIFDLLERHFEETGDDTDNFRCLQEDHLVEL